MAETPSDITASKQHCSCEVECAKMRATLVKQDSRITELERYVNELKNRFSHVVGQLTPVSAAPKTK